jgi:hypothetical protein
MITISHSSQTLLWINFHISAAADAPRLAGSNIYVCVSHRAARSWRAARIFMA